ncbi:MAG: hypothetical protein WC264_00765 [Candidatus Paceibacterota bacterium]|jgi:cell division septal protein FtsQ
MQKRNVLNSKHLEELKRKKRRILRNKIIFFVIIFIIFLTGLIFLSRWENININTIRVLENKVVETKDIVNIIHSKIDGHYLGLFPKTNFILLPNRAIKNELHSKFKRLKDIKIDTTDTNTLEITVSEYNGKYTWCGNDIPLDESPEENKCYFMDENGYIFDEAIYFSGNVYFKFFGKIKDDTENPIGSYFLPENFTQIISFVDNLKQMGIKLSSLLTKEDGDIEIYLKPNNSVNIPKIIFKSTSDFNKVAENLQSVLTTEPFQSDFKNKYSSLLYIDLRFGNKVYYKFAEKIKNE